MLGKVRIEVAGSKELLDLWWGGTGMVEEGELSSVPGCYLSTGVGEQSADEWHFSAHVGM